MPINETQLKEVYNKILSKAKEDGVITEEEQAILDKLKLDISKYENLLTKASEDHVITEGEARELQEYRAKMLEGAWLTADNDSVINKDETRMLDLLLQLLRKVDI